MPQRASAKEMKFDSIVTRRLGQIFVIFSAVYLQYDTSTAF